MDLSTKSNDTVELLRQWQAVYRLPKRAPSGAFRRADAPGQIVQLVATILASGRAYYPADSLTPEIVELARDLNGPANEFALTPEFKEALDTGEPVLARANGVASEPIL